MYRFNDFKGDLTLLNTGGESYGNPMMSFSGDCTGAKIFALGFCSGGTPGFLPDPDKTAGAKIAVIMPRGNLPNLPNVGTADPDFIKAMLQQARFRPPS